MAQYCTRRHLPGKAIQLSEAAASCSMASCRHKRAIDLILEALASEDGAQNCIHWHLPGKVIQLSAVAASCAMDQLSTQASD
jgi:hypothetical protein